MLPQIKKEPKQVMTVLSEITENKESGKDIEVIK
jgi:hypothetical protein